MKIRRSRFVLFALEDIEQLDVPQLLRGQVQYSERTVIIAIALAAFGKEHQLSFEEFALLTRIPRSWTPRDRFEEKEGAGVSLQSLIQAGLVVCRDGGDAVSAASRMEARLIECGWTKEAALFHFSSVKRFDGPEGELSGGELASDPDQVARYVDLHGSPPAAFFRYSEAYSPLPTGEDHDLGSREALRRRATCRSFDQGVPLSKSQLGTLLFESFGCHGTADLGSGFELLQRNCPSGGSLHPIEAYLLVRDVADLPTGAYHYGGEMHGLAKRKALPEASVEQAALSCCRGQQWAAQAHVLIFMVARFDRVGWKYRSVERAYSVVMMDAGHLGQAIALVATELGLGQFFTAAINFREVTSLFDLKDPAEVPVAAIGCGPPCAKRPVATLVRRPYQAQSTRSETEDPGAS